MTPPTQTGPAPSEVGPPSHASMAAALAAFQGEVPTVTKGNTAEVEMRSGGKYRYSYADLADVARVAYPVMARHGLSFACRSEMVEPRSWVLTGRLRHASGEEDTSSLPLAMGTPQEVGSALTYARRYLLGMMTGIVTDDDDDGRGAQSGHQRAREEGQEDARRAAAEAERARAQAETERAKAQADAHRAEREGLAKADADTVLSYRAKAVEAADTLPTGEARAARLRDLYARADKDEALGSVVTLPEPWQAVAKVQTVTLSELIRGATAALPPSTEGAEEPPAPPARTSPAGVTRGPLSEDPWATDPQEPPHE